MDFSFSEEEETFRQEVRTFLDENLTERLRAGSRGSPGVFVEPDISEEWQAILAKKGWLTYYWPEEYGGMGWTPTQRYIYEKELALNDAPFLPVMGVKLLGPIICKFGTDKQKQEILPRIISGEDYWCQGFSETGAGSDLANLRTRAEKVGEKYIINGGKIWTTLAHHATHIFCLVRTDPDSSRQQGISFILVDLRQPGVEIRPIIGIAGDHEVNEIFFDNAETSVDNLVGEEGQGWGIAKFLLENERRGSCRAPKILADIALVRALAANTANGHAGNLSDDRDFMRGLIDLELEALALEATEFRILADVSAGRTGGGKASVSKLIGSKLRQDVDAAAFRVAGYAGLQLETQRPLYGNTAPEPIHSKAAQYAAPTYLNSRAWTIFGGTNEIQKTIIAKAVLGV